MKLSDAELATVLAALRHWQSEVPQADRDNDPIANNEGAAQVLVDADIDRLCEKLNTEMMIEPEDGLRRKVFAVVDLDTGDLVSFSSVATKDDLDAEAQFGAAIDDAQANGDSYAVLKLSRDQVERLLESVKTACLIDDDEIEASS